MHRVKRQVADAPGFGSEGAAREARAAGAACVRNSRYCDGPKKITDKTRKPQFENSPSAVASHYANDQVVAAMVMARIPLSPQWRRALEMLADAEDRGVSSAALLASGFSAETLDSLVQVGLAIPTGAIDELPASLRITDAGRRVFDLCSSA